MEFNGKTVTAYGGFYDTHMADKNNPHEVTAEQVGAALAGYGLGEASSTSSNWNGTQRNGFYRGNTGSPDGEWWYGLNLKYYNNCMAQIAFKAGESNDSLLQMAMRHRPTTSSSGTFGEWEHVNPPMLEGVEYRTIERYNGKAIYVKLVNLGEFAPAGEKNDVVIAGGVVDIVDAKMSVRGADGCSRFNCGVTWEVFTVADGDCVCSFERNNLTDGATASVLVKYTKE